jgi:hypothetical protein
MNKISKQLAAQIWCSKALSSRVLDTEITGEVAKIIDRLLDTVEIAWGIIANANWDNQNKEWQASGAIIVFTNF